MSDRVTVNSAPQRGLISLHFHNQMVELTPFDAEDLGRKLIDNANDCVTDEKYVSADEAPKRATCRHCGDRIDLQPLSTGGDWCWYDRHGSSFCTDSEGGVPGRRSHYPVNPVEGIDY